MSKQEKFIASLDVIRQAETLTWFDRLVDWFYEKFGL